MSEATQQTMHPDFPRWCREVSVDENRERLHARWAGVSSIVPTLDHPAIENLLRIVFKAKNGLTAETTTKIRQSFKAADDLFDMQGNDRELEVLGGCILAILLENNSNVAAWAALAITASFLDGKRSLQLPMDLSASAENTIARLAEINRKRPDFKSARVELPKLAFTKAKEKLTTIDAAGIGAALDAAADAINTNFAALVKKMNTALDVTADFTAIQDEELNMLWWFLGERSNGLKKAFEAIPESERPLVFGAELAEATVSLPGPLSVEGLLGRAGLNISKPLSIPEAVNACGKTWLEEAVSGKTFSTLAQPIHFAIQRKLETGDSTSWVSGWAGSCSIDPAATFSSLTLGKLFYRERLLLTF